MKTIIKQEAHVIVTREVGYYDEELFNDGDTVYIKKHKDVTTISLIKDGKVAITTEFIQTDGKMPKGAVARIGWSDVYVSQATFDIINKLKKEVADIQIDDEEKAPKEIIKAFVKNPAYSHMSDAEIKAAEKNWDNIQNEGYSDGYNPYRRHPYPQAPHRLARLMFVSSYPLRFYDKALCFPSLFCVQLPFVLFAH